MWVTWLNIDSSSKCQLETQLDDQSTDSAVSITHWSSFKHLFTYMQVLDCNDVFFTR